MLKFFSTLLDLIYKKKCYFCGKSKYSVKMCSDCYNELSFADTNVNRIIDGVNIYCAGTYTKELQKMIRGLKYHRQKELAYYQAKFMYDYFCNISFLKNKKFVLIPVPLHLNRIKKRKYNHMELVCEEFGKLGDFESNFNLIKRVKDTKPQYNLNRKERMCNLYQAFEVDETQICPDTALLIMDDICTTGSTFEEMITTLKNAGINDITCFATATPL